MISVIIPTYNEEKHIAKTIEWLRQPGFAVHIKQIIIADGNSSDNTVNLALSLKVIAVISAKKGRAAQMNYGAAFATQPVLYFLHADTLPPVNFTTDIVNSVNHNYAAGCFMLSFDVDHWFLKANCWFTRFDVDAIRFGDQSLFIAKKIFKECNGFNEDYIVLEDQEFIKRIRKKYRFIIIKKPVITSARKYIENGIYKTQAIFFLIYFMHRFGYSQHKLISTYRKLIKQDKL